MKSNGNEMSDAPSQNVQRALALFDYYDDYEGDDPGLQGFSLTELVAATLVEMGVKANILSCAWIDKSGIERDKMANSVVAIEVDQQIVSSLGTLGWADTVNKTQEVRGEKMRFGALLTTSVVTNHLGGHSNHPLRPLVRRTAGWRLAQEAAAALCEQTVVSGARPKNPRL